MENWTMTRGDTLSFGVELFSDTNAATPFTNDLETAVFTISRNGTTVAQKSLVDGVQKKGTGVYIVRVAPVDTATVDLGEYEYTLTVTINDDAFTLLRGTLMIQ
jgi:hypothetical protein